MGKLSVEQLLLNTDTYKVKETEDRIEQNASKVDEIVQRLVDGYARPLDEYINFCKDIITV